MQLECNFELFQDCHFRAQTRVQPQEKANLLNSNQLHVPRYGPTMHLATSPCLEHYCVFVCPDSALTLISSDSWGGVREAAVTEFTCHGKRAVMLREKLGFSIITLSSVWCSGEWGLIGSNPVETRNRAERWGAGENWDWSGRNRRHQTCKILSLRGREKTIPLVHGGYEEELQAYTWVREPKSFLSLKIAHSRKGNRPFMVTGIIYYQN